MSQGELGTRPPGPITIDQLLALNAEITALVRAGVPLERGLLVAGGDIQGRLGRIAAALGRRMSRGESLVDALNGEKQTIPPLYRAVVEAGARSGQLPVALEGLARYVRSYSEARRAIGLALWYPVIVLALAYGLFVGLVQVAMPNFVSTFVELGLPVAAPIRWLAWIGGSAQYWWPVGPILLALLAIAWVRSGAVAQFQSKAWNGLRLVPWMRSLLVDYETANFSELLALLLEHQVAYPSALILAAEATGNEKLKLGATQVAEAIKRGEPAGEALGTIDRQNFLPMLRWVLATGQEQGSLVAALHNLADLYRKRANYQAEKLYVFLPMILMIGIGGTATLCYGLALFLPLINLMRDLEMS
jgi:type II secretory pathway component PulF